MSQYFNPTKLCDDCGLMSAECVCDEWDGEDWDVDNDDYEDDDDYCLDCGEYFDACQCDEPDYSYDDFEDDWCPLCAGGIGTCTCFSSVVPSGVKGESKSENREKKLPERQAEDRLKREG